MPGGHFVTRTAEEGEKSWDREAGFGGSSSRLLLALAALALLGNLLACSTQGPEKPKPQVPPGGILLRGAGATFPSLLYKQWFATYQQAHPQTVITYDSVGSGEGIRRFIGRNVKDEEQGRLWRQ